MKASGFVWATMGLAAVVATIFPWQYGGGGATGTSHAAPGIDMVSLAAAWLGPASWLRRQRGL